MGLSDEFMKENMWIIVLVVLLFVAFVGYGLNKNIDPSECEDDQEGEDTEPKTNNTDEDK